MSFDGDTSFILVDKNYQSSSHTACTWFRAATTSSAFILDKYFHTENAWGVYIHGVAGLRIWDDIAGADSYIYSTPVPVNEWVHMCAGINASQNNFLYVNGALRGDSIAAADTWSSVSPSDFYIGRRGNDTLYFTGDIDDVRIYNRELSVEEVQQLYNLGR
jgi:hypothetical protein